MVYFSDLKGRTVFDSHKKKVGSLIDFVFVDGEEYAEVTHIVCVFEDNSKRKIRFSAVDELKGGKKIGKENIVVNLNVPQEKLTCFFLKENDLIVGNIIDKQVVDVDGAKIVRVNDVILGKVKNKLCVVAVAVGKKSFLRRLGLEQVLPFKVKDHIIPVESMEYLEPQMHDIHLNVQKSKIADLHPEDIADVMEDMSHKERALIFNSLNKQVAAETLIGAEPEVQQSVFKSLKINRIKELLEDVPADQAADILSFMESSERDQILGIMRPEAVTEIREILDYHPESAGAIMDTSFIGIPEDYTVQQTINLLRKLAPPSDKIYHLYVVDKQNHLLGVLSSRGLIIAPPKEKVSNLMKKEVIHVKTDTTEEDIAKTITRYDLFVLPVVDQDNVLRGVVTAEDILTEIMPDEWRRDRFRPHKIKKIKNGRS
ncbi:MAG: CBS domain-containing protein [Candidatus Altiarchaeota archaeon]